MTNTQTIVALATPVGTGAIGIIRLSGPEAIAIIAKVFKGKDLTKHASHTIHLGKIVEEGLVLDEVLVSLFVAPRSYTRENVVEISCHGSAYIIESIIKLLIKNGARSAKPGEFTLRAFLNGQLDLSQAEAVADLIAANSKASQQVAMEQLRGGFSNQLQQLREQLVQFASLIELELDFAEEDVEFANREQLSKLIHQILRVIGSLIQSFGLGNAMKQGVNTVIAGRPNAGKSTLLNALLNEERAIVSHIPGTTRDTIEEILNINGINFRLIDTAGIREATDAIEQIGVQRTMEKISQSALLVYLFDASSITAEELQQDIESLQKPGITMLVVGNKVDLLGSREVRKYESTKVEGVFSQEDGKSGSQKEGGAFSLEDGKSDNQTFTTTGLPDFQTTGLPDFRTTGLPDFRTTGLPDYFPISAKEKLQIEELKQHIYHAAIKGHINDDETLVTNIRHLEALQLTEEALKRVMDGLHTTTSDFLSMDIKQALHYLGEITGEVTTDDLLENIFSRFCIGK
jgi:tRNA modification GTPase